MRDQEFVVQIRSETYISQFEIAVNSINIWIFECLMIISTIEECSQFLHKVVHFNLFN